FLFTFFNSFSQEKEKIIFLFGDENDVISETRNQTIYRIDNNHTFKFIKEKHEKFEVKYNTIKDKIVSYNDFLKKNRGKKHPEFFNEYSFYIFILDKDNTGCLIEVEKIWLVEDKIID